MNAPPLVQYPYERDVDWALWRYMDIPDIDVPRIVYLRRLILFKTPWCGLYVHWIYTTDDGRAPHDHPMNFASLVWFGGYWERLYRCVDGVREYVGAKAHSEESFHVMRKGLFHRITTLMRTPTVTVVFWWKRVEDWGYLRRDGFYVSSKVSRGQEA